jgi:RNase P subunit RPR2
MEAQSGIKFEEEKALQQLKFPSFPERLGYQYSTKSDIPLHQYEKLRFQYHLLTTSTNSFIIHQISKSFIDLYAQEQIAMPMTIINRFCPFCSCFLINGLTSSQRLRNRTKRSQRNHHRRIKMKNELVSLNIFINL